MTAETDLWWLEQALCKGATRVFYDDIWPDPEQRDVDEVALDRARAICAACPVIEPCAADGRARESRLPRRDRHGLRAGLTPVERWREEQQARAIARGSTSKLALNPSLAVQPHVRAGA